MDVENTTNNAPDSVFIELSTHLLKLKQDLKDKYDKEKSSKEDEYELAYIRGHYFGQLSAMEDCYNLFLAILSSSSKKDSNKIVALKQQLAFSIKVIEELTNKVKDNQPIEDYINSLQETISLIKESSLK